jgi:hypothetical protein
MVAQALTKLARQRFAARVLDAQQHLFVRTAAERQEARGLQVVVIDHHS